MESRLSQDSYDTRLNKGFPEVPLLQDSFEVPPKALSKIPLSQEGLFENRSEVIFKWLDLPDVREQAGEVTPMSEMTFNEMDKMLSQDMTDADVANGTRTNEITLVLPHFEVEESKPRRARDVMSASPPSQVQGKKTRNRKRAKSKESKSKSLARNKPYCATCRKCGN